MDLAFAAADLAISRAGSATVSELAAVGLPAVFVPYPVGNGEQAYNAVDALRAGGAVLVADAAFTPEWVRGRAAAPARGPGAGRRTGGPDRHRRAPGRRRPDGRPGLRGAGLAAELDSILVIAPDLTLDVPRDLGRVHFIGIGGSGMSGIAHMMLDAGIEVSGSDRSDSAYLDKLRARGARISVGHDAANVGDADTIVFTTALWPDNPEYLLARDRGLTLLHRSQALHWLSRGRRVITVAGASARPPPPG